MLTDFLIALGLNGVMALGVSLFGTMRWMGIGSRVSIGMLISLGVGWQGFVILLVFFLLNNLLIEVGYRLKQDLGIAPERKKYRENKHSLISCAPGIVLALIGFIAKGWTEVLPLWIHIGFATSFVTAVTDTVAREMGQMFGKHPVLLPGFRPVPIGTPGAVSLPGTLFGIGIACAMSIFSTILLNVFECQVLVIMVISATFGTLLESVATAQGQLWEVDLRPWFNVMNPPFGAITAMVLSAIFL